jgi:hypothetical protein
MKKLNKSALQTIAACMVYESDLSKSSQVQLIRFIEEATEKQLQHYILHEEIVKDSEVQINELIPFLAAAAILSAAVAAGRAIYDGEFSKAAQACKDQEEGVRKSGCIKRFKLRGITGKISALRREMGKCTQTVKPDKCRKMFAKYIANAQKQMRKIQAS